MRTHLLYPDRRYDPDAPLPPQSAELIQDLGLGRLFTTMAVGDEFLHQTTAHVMLNSATSRDTIEYRQAILHDFLQLPDLASSLYRLATDAAHVERTIFHSIFNDRASVILANAVQMLEALTEPLHMLRSLAQQYSERVSSPGLKAMITSIIDELDDEFFARMDAQLKTLTFRRGVLISAHLGTGNHGVNYRVRTPHQRHWTLSTLLQLPQPGTLTFTIAPRDEAGSVALDELRNRGLDTIAHTVGQSSDHIVGFFSQLRFEAGFYLACLNLKESLLDTGHHVSIPHAHDWDDAAYSWDNIYDPVLALGASRPLVGNSHDDAEQMLVLITGANSGGKSTLLRSLGIAQLMMQAGMFTANDAFSAPVCQQVFTHFARDENTHLQQGRFDDELSRMSIIANQATPRSLILFNESFASTNEREGSEIAATIIHSLIDSGIRVCIVTHLSWIRRPASG